MNETPITIVGNTTGDVEVRYTQAGTPVGNFTVASTPRTFDKQRGEWVDGDPLFLRCTIWGVPAQNANMSLHKGTRVVVTGTLRQRSYQDREGNARTAIEVDVDEVAPSLRFATAVVSRTVASGRPQEAASGPQPPAQVSADQWASIGAETPW